MQKAKITLILTLAMILSACATKMMHPNLTFSKTVGVDTVQRGDIIEIRCQLKNEGRGTAYNVVVEPELPIGVKLDEKSLKTMPVRNINHTLGGSWRIGNIGPGESLILTYQAIVEDAQSGETLHLKTRIRFWDAKYQDKDYTADFALVVEAPPQLKISKSMPDRAMPSDTLICEIVVKNTGGGEIQGVFIEDQIPEGFRYRAGSLTTSAGVSLEETSDVYPFVWPLPNLKSGSEVKIGYELFISENVAPGEKKVAITRATGKTQRGEPLRAETSILVSILPEPKLVLKKQISSTDLAFDDSIICVLTMENRGAGMAKDCIIQDTMPSFFNYEDGSDSSSISGIQTKHPYQWIVGDLPPGKSVQIAYKVKVEQTKDAVYEGHAATVNAMTETGRKLQVQSNAIQFQITNVIGKTEPHRKLKINRENQVYIGKPQ